MKHVALGVLSFAWLSAGSVVWAGDAEDRATAQDSPLAGMWRLVSVEIVRAAGTFEARENLPKQLSANPVEIDGTRMTLRTASFPNGTHQKFHFERVDAMAPEKVKAARATRNEANTGQPSEGLTIRRAALSQTHGAQRHGGCLGPPP